MEWAVQGCGHSPKLPEFKEYLDSALRCRVWILGGAVRGQEVDSVFLMRPFQLGIFCDSKQ